MAQDVGWGIEVGSGAVKAIKLEMRGDGPVITDFAVIPHTLPLSAPGVDADDAMRVAIGTFASQVDLRKARVAVSVPGDAALARFAKLPPVEPKKVPEIVKFEAAQQVPFPLEEVEWDYQTFQSPDSPEIEVGIFAIPKNRLNLHLQMLADVGLDPDVINLSPVAAYNALAYDLQFTEQTVGTVILDIGSSSTDLIVAESGRVWVRTFRMGGHNLTEALVDQFNLPYNKAERLKRDADKTEHAAKVVRAMRGSLTELAQEVQRSIGSYQAKRPEAKLTRIVGLGATFQLPGLRKFLKQQSGLEVFRFDEFKKAEMDEALGERKEQLEQVSGSMCTSYGLALQALEMDTIRSNLAPVANLRTAMWKRKVPAFGVAAGVAVAAAGFMFFRPLADQAASAGVRPPPEIQRAASQANTMKREAQDSEALGGAKVSTLAANGIALAEDIDDEVYAQLMRDIGAFRGQLASGDDAEDFELVSVQTQFVKPGIELASTLKPAGAGRRDDSRRDDRSGRGGDPFGGSRPAFETHEDMSRIYVRMELRTANQNGDAEYLRVGVPWLSDEARSGEDAPYSIIATTEWGISSWKAPLEVAGNEDGDEENPTPRPDPSNPDGPQRPERGDPRPGEGGPQRPGAPGNPGQPAAPGSIDELAPLESPEPEGAERTGELVVHFYVVIGGVEDSQDSFADGFND